MSIFVTPQRVWEFAVGQQERDEAATGVGRIAKGQVTPPTVASPNGAALQRNGLVALALQLGKYRACANSANRELLEEALVSLE